MSARRIRRDPNLPFPLREGAGGGVRKATVVHWTYPSPNPLPQGEVEKLS
jgi:hypothetical protein